MKAAPSHLDRLLSALCHLGVVLLLAGPVFCAVVWGLRRRASSYSGFQSLQALVYQLFLTLVFVGVLAFNYAVQILLIGLGAVSPSTGMPNNAFSGLLLMPSSALAFILMIYSLSVVYGLLGFLKTLEGEEFKYFFVADYVEKKVSAV